MLQLVAGIVAVAILAWECASEKNDEEDGGTTPTQTDNTGNNRDAGKTPVASLDAGPADGNTPIGPTKDGGTGKADAGTTPKPLDRYVPPSEPISPPPPISSGIFYHRFAENGQRIGSAFPVSLSCRGQNCEFALPAISKAYSFAASSLNNSDDVPVTMMADFSSDIDGAITYMATMLHLGGYYYGLYDSFDPFGAPGIAIRPEGGDNSMNSYSFPSVDETHMTTPNSLLPYENGAERNIWVSISNLVNYDFQTNKLTYGPGKVFHLEQMADGSLIVDPDKNPLTSTQLDPQAMALWNAGTKKYILVANTGNTNPQDNSETAKESGMDVIDSETKNVVANIPLGNAAANAIAISPDGAAAFLSSQALPNIYVVDLERLKVRLEAINPRAETPESITDVVAADASNPVPLPDTATFVPSILYDDPTRSLILASNNDETVIQVRADYDVFSGIGISLKDRFGTVAALYDCTGEGTLYCSTAAFINGGVPALTGNPTSVTFIPDESLVQR